MSTVATYVDRLKRAFTTPGAVKTAEQFWGIQADEWKPEAYGEYVAKSTYVHICVQRRAQDLASLPIVLYRTTRTGRTPVETGNVRMLLDKVNPFWTSTRLINMTEQALSLWGEAFWTVERGASGRGTPRELWWVRPDHMKVHPDPQNYISHFTYITEEGGIEQRFEPSEVIWLRKPNPLNQWAGLSPLVAARLAADTMSAAMRSNYSMFSNGMRISGVIGPKAGQPPWVDDQFVKIKTDLDRRFKGEESAHKWALMKYEMSFTPMQMSQKDAEFVELHRMTKEDICNSFGVPLDLIGGQRTYENYTTARESYWSDTIIPEAAWIAAEITEQLLPMFGEADVAEFDTSDVAALKESEDAKQLRVRENVTKGLLIYDEAREALGLDPLPNGQGQVLMIPAGLTIIKPSDLPAKADMTMTPPPDPMEQQDGTSPDAPHDEQSGAGQEQPRSMARNTRAVAYGSDEHRRLWEARVNRTDRHEATMRRVVEDLMRNQRKSVLAKLTGRTARAVDPLELSENPFDKSEWVKKFRASLRPVLTQVVMDVGEAALAELAIGVSFNVKDPNVVRFLDQRAQRFAVQVNDTTWTALKDSLAQGIDSGEGIDELAKRVEQVMGNRIRSDAETIARTEVIGASNGGTQISWEQSGVVAGKEWLAALDDRTRDTHIEAHGQRRRLDEDFDVGGGSGPTPGQIDLAEESINCRCAMVAVLDVDWTEP